MFSGGSDGEGAEVVGQDRPGGPGAGAVVAFEAGAFEAVAAFEMADAALDADSEACEALVGASGAGGLAAGDEHAAGAGEVFGDADREEAAVEREVAWPEVQTVELGRGRGKQVGLVGRADL